MENTLENKAKFFALYYGQTVLTNTFDVSDIRKLDFWYLENVSKNYLLSLKPLSAISDEDAYGVGILVNCWSWTERRMDFFKDDELRETHVGFGKMFTEAIGKEWGPGFSHPFANNSTDILHAYDYLRSKGYALPFLGLSVEAQISYGWVKLAEVC